MDSDRTLKYFLRTHKIRKKLLTQANFLSHTFIRRQRKEVINRINKMRSTNYSVFCPLSSVLWILSSDKGRELL